MEVEMELMGNSDQLMMRCFVKTVKDIVGLLKGMEFDIVSFHSRLGNGPVVVEKRQLKSQEIFVMGTLVKVFLSPSRSLSFDLKEYPEIMIVSDRQIRIIRHLSSRDTVTRIILINKKTTGE